MIVGCYSLHLYCDTEGCPNSMSAPDHGAVSGSRAPGEFTHETNEQGAMAKARRAGWKLDLKNWTCRCPACSKTRG